MLSNLRISFKLLAMVVLAFAGVATVALLGLAELKANLIEDRKAKLLDVVQLAVQNATHEYQESIAAGLTEQAATLRVKSALRGLRYGNDDYIFAYDKAGVAQVVPDPKGDGQVRWDLKDSNGVYMIRELVAAAAKGGGFVSYRFPRAAGTAPAPKLSYAVIFKPNDWHDGWIVGSGIYIDDVDTIFWSQVWHIGAFVGLTLLLVIGVCLLLGRSITRPVNNLTGVMRDLAGGNLDVAIPHTLQRDELGQMARAVEVFKQTGIATKRLTAEQTATRDAKERRHAAMDQLTQDFGASISGVMTALGGSTDTMREAANAMSIAAAGAHRQATGTAERATQSSHDLTSIAAAVEQMTASIDEIARQVAAAAQVARTASDRAAANHDMMRGLADAATRIGRRSA